MILTTLFVSQINIKGFDSSFECLGVQEEEYLQNIALVDSMYNLQTHVLIEVIPKETNFARIHEDVIDFEEKLHDEFEEAEMRNWIKTLPFLFSEKELQSGKCDSLLKEIKDIELFENLIADDLSSLLLVLEVPDNLENKPLDKFKTALDNSSLSKNHFVRTISPLHIGEALNISVIRDIFRIIIMLLLVFVFIMFVAYRNFFAIFYLVLVVVICFIVALGIHSFLGEAFNLITINALPIVIVLSAADAIHLLTGYYSQDENLPNEEKIEKTYAKYFLPSLLTSLTTAVAFLSLLFNVTQSVINLAWVSAASVIAAFFICYFMTPFIFKYASSSIKPNPLFKRIAQFFIGYRKAFTYSIIPIFFIAIYLLPQLSFKNDYEMFLPRGSQEKIDHDIIRSKYGSTGTMDLVLKLEDEKVRYDELELVQDKISKIDNILNVKSSSSNAIIFTKFGMPIDLAKTAGYKNKFEAGDGLYQRILITVKDPNSIVLVKDEILNILSSYPSENYIISSSILAYNNVNKQVGKSLIKSLVSSTIFLLFVFLILTRSILPSLIGLFANLVPLSLIVIIFVLFDFHINILTAITAVVCLGIIVDDTIHSFYRRVVRREALHELSFGMLTTTFILASGFMTFLISDVQPIRIFGSVCSIVFMITLVSDLTLLLFLMDLYDKWKLKKQAS